MMGRSATLSPLGLYNWDNTIFDQMVIPDALDRDTLIENLLLQTAELEVLYTNPATFKHAIGFWSRKELDVWNRLYQTTQYEYDPIENYNRYEQEADTGTRATVQGGKDSRDVSISHTGSDTTTITHTDGGSEATGKSSNTAEGGTQSTDMTRAQTGADVEAGNSKLTNGGQDIVVGSETKGHFVAGFDASLNPGPNTDGLVKQTRDETDNTVTTTYGKTETGETNKATAYGKAENNNDTTSFGKTVHDGEVGATVYDRKEETVSGIEYGGSDSHTDETTYGKQEATGHADVRKNHAHGNIGVTTTQQLIKEQREVERFNLYDYILDSFKMRFCILVY